MILAACGAPATPELQTEPSATSPLSHTPTPTVTTTPSATPTITLTPSLTPTRRPTITPLPAERDDRPASVPSIALEPGGYLSWQGYVEQLDDDQDWLAFYVPAGQGEEVTLTVQTQCGGGDTARVRLFSDAVSQAQDSDGNGRINIEEALATGTTVADFDMGCLLRKDVSVPGSADYYLVVYAASGGQTWYFLALSR